MNRRGVNRAFDEKQESEKTTHNPFRNGVRGNIKSNSQIDSFVKSQEVFKLLQNTLGTPAIPVASKSFRIPLKHSPPRDTASARSELRNTSQERNRRNNRNSFDDQRAGRSNSWRNDRVSFDRQRAGGRGNSRQDDRGSFDNQRAGRGNSRQDDRGSFDNQRAGRGNSWQRDQDSFDNQRAGLDNSRQDGRGNNDSMPSSGDLFSRREHNSSSSYANRFIDEPSTSSFSNFSRKRSRDDFDWRGNLEDPAPKYSAFNEVFGNTTWRDVEMPEPANQFVSTRPSEHNQLQDPPFDSHGNFQHRSDRSIQGILGGSNPYSNMHVQHIEESPSTESLLDNPFLNAYSPRHENFSPMERFLRNRDSQRGRDRSDGRSGEELQSNDAMLNACSSRRRESYSSSERFSRDRDSQRGRDRSDDRSGQEERQTNDAKLNACSSRRRESYSSSERFSRDRDSQRGRDRSDDSSGQEQQNSAHPKREKKKRNAEKNKFWKLLRVVRKAGAAKPCKLEINDKSVPKGRIAEHNVPKLLKLLTDLVKESVLVKKNKVCYPKYLGYTYIDGLFTLGADSIYSCDFLQAKLPTVTPPWRGALLKGIKLSNSEHFVDVKVPKTISHFSEFRTLCEESNSGLITRTWRVAAFEDCEDGDRRLFTIGMEEESYDIIKNKLNGLVRCGEEEIEFVLRKDNILYPVK